MVVSSKSHLIFLQNMVEVKKLKPLPFTNLSNYDKRRFAVCKHLKETKSDDIDDVILISMNDSTRLGADYLEIKAEEPKFRLFPILKNSTKDRQI